MGGGGGGGLGKSFAYGIYGRPLISVGSLKDLEIIKKFLDFLTEFYFRFHVLSFRDLDFVKC